MLSFNHGSSRVVSMLLVTALAEILLPLVRCSHCDDAASHPLQHIVTMPYNLSCIPAVEQGPHQLQHDVH